jgi:arylsulfatase A-like enzyme
MVLGNRFTPGCLAGLTAWLAFGVVEMGVLTYLPWVITPRHLLVTLHPGFTALLLTTYALAGMFCGWALNRGFRIRSDSGAQAAATGSVLVVYVILMLLEPPHRMMERLSLFIAPILLGAVTLGNLPGLIGRLLRLFRNPWVAATVLFLPSWIATGPLDERPLWQVGIAVASSGLVVTLIGAWFVGTHNRLITLRFGRHAALATVLAVCGCLGTAVIRQTPVITEQERRPVPHGKANVVLIILDTVRADRLSAYGYERPTTPNLKALATEAVLYEHAYSSGDMTLTTHASLFTGLYPTRHGAHRSKVNPGGRPLDPSRTTLAEMLTSRGYETAFVAANTAFLSSFHGLGQGFGFYDHRAPVPFLGAARPFSLRNGVRNLLARFMEGRHFDQVTRRAGEINDVAIEQIDRMRGTGRPFLLCTNYMDAHWPYVPPEPFHEQFPGRDETFRLEDYYELVPTVMMHHKKVTDAQEEHLRSQYDSSLAYIDSEIGRLLKRLRDTGVYDNSLIIITSDHGEAFGEHGLIGHGVSVYQEHIHVPLLIKFPKGSPGEKWHGTSRAEAVNSVDLLPTIFDVIGYPAPTLDGVSVLRVSPEITRPIYSESFSSHALLAITKTDRVQRAIITGKWKLIEAPSEKPQLYDLVADSREQKDLRNSEPQLANSLAGTLKLWASRAAVKHGREDRPDRQTMDALKSLGYLQ